MIFNWRWRCDFALFSCHNILYIFLMNIIPLYYTSVSECDEAKLLNYNFSHYARIRIWDISMWYRFKTYRYCAYILQVGICKHKTSKNGENYICQEATRYRNKCLSKIEVSEKEEFYGINFYFVTLLNFCCFYFVAKISNSFQITFDICHVSNEKY